MRNLVVNIPCALALVYVSPVMTAPAASVGPSPPSVRESYDNRSF